MIQNPIKDEDYFPLVNRGICMYCKNLVVAWSSDGQGDTKYGCGSRQENGKYVSNDIDSERIDFFGGCERFGSSGVPTHPTLMNLLIEENPLAKNIPVSLEAIEQGIEFEIKVRSNLTAGHLVNWQDIA
jgi:hypothetical protein